MICLRPVEDRANPSDWREHVEPEEIARRRAAFMRAFEGAALQFRSILNVAGMTNGKTGTLVRQGYAGQAGGREAGSGVARVSVGQAGRARGKEKASGLLHGLDRRGGLQPIHTA